MAAASGARVRGGRYVSPFRHAHREGPTHQRVRPLSVPGAPGTTVTGVYGQPNVSWGNYARFVDYTAKLNWFSPAAMIPALAMIATAAETPFGLLLVLGWNTASLLC